MWPKFLSLNLPTKVSFQSKKCQIKLLIWLGLDITLSRFMMQNGIVEVKIEMWIWISKFNVSFGNKESPFGAYTQTRWSSVYLRNKEKFGDFIKWEMLCIALRESASGLVRFWGTGKFVWWATAEGKISPGVASCLSSYR